jgi:hypothetical protein
MTAAYRWASSARSVNDALHRGLLEQHDRSVVVTAAGHQHAVSTAVP